MPSADQCVSDDRRRSPRLLRRPAQGASAREGRAARPDRCGVRARRPGRPGADRQARRGAGRVPARPTTAPTCWPASSAPSNILRDEEKKDKTSYAGAADVDAAHRAGGEALAAAIEKVKQDTRRRHQRGELRRRHAGAGRAARAGRCVLRQGDGQRARCGACAPTGSRCCRRSARRRSTWRISPRLRGSTRAWTTGREHFGRDEDKARLHRPFGWILDSLGAGPRLRE